MMKYAVIIFTALMLALSFTACKGPKSKELEKKVLDQEQALRLHHENMNKFYESLKTIQETELQIDKMMESRKPNTVDVDQEILKKIEILKGVVTDQKKKIADMQKQVAYYKPYKEQYEGLKKEVAMYQMIIADKDKKIAEMEENIKRLQTKNEELTKENVQLTVEKNTIYFTFGEKNELIERGAVRKSGGNLFGGKTLIPVNDPSLFTSGDKREIKTIDAGAPIEKIVLERKPESYKINGNVVEIIDPVEFWKNPYLVIIINK